MTKANIKNHFFAVIPAAGKSSRMETGSSKQFIELRGIPVLARTLLVFEGSSHIDGIIIICGSSEIAKVSELCVKYKISKLIAIAEGGDSRQASVRNGLEKLADTIDAETAGSSYVLIHDGARPFLSDRVVNECVETVIDSGACICAVPVKDTIKRAGDDGLVEETVPRENLWSVQTPQTFKFTDILTIHRKVATESAEFTDDASVAESFGMKIKIISGDYTNIKITTREDLLLGEIIVSGQVSREVSL